MKKFLTLTLFLMFSMLISANQQQDSTKISNTERIVDKYGGKVVEGFNSVVNKITPVIQQGFEIAVRKKYC